MGEYEGGQRKQVSKTITNGRLESRQLKVFTDNRNTTIVQRKVKSEIMGNPGYTKAKEIETATLGTHWFQYKKDDIPQHFENNIISEGENVRAQTESPVTNPIVEKKVNLSTISLGKGKSISGTEIDIKTATRDQHFSVADKAINKKEEDRRGKYTWHHLLDKYFMDLIDMQVHKGFWHTGGFDSWQS